jgi:hypothetical protein
MVTDKSLKNLKSNHGQGVPGAGRKPKSQTLIDRMRDKLTEPCPFDTVSPQRTWIECLAEAELKHALTDTGARTDLLNRLCGKPVESVELTGKNGEAILIREVEVRLSGTSNGS